VIGPSLYDLATSATGSQCELVAFDLQKSAAGALDFMLGVDDHDRPLVKHSVTGASVKKGDR